MEYVVYIDMMFLTDFFLNLLSLLLTSVLLQKKPKAARVLLAAVIGSVWSCVLVVCPIVSGYLELFITMFGIGSFMTLISFRFVSNIRSVNVFAYELIRADMALLLASSVLSGCLSFTREHFYLKDWESLAVTGAVVGAVMLFLENLMKSRGTGAVRYSVFLYYNGSSREFKALADSGNRLHVPETGKPVSLISYRDCAGFCDKVSGGFFIPYRAVGTDHGLLFAITFEKMEIRKDEMCITIENPAVAIVKESLSSSGDFNMLLPEEYVTERNASLRA